MEAQQKHVIVDNLQPNSDNTYTIPAGGTTEQAVTLDFGQQVTYRVVKLDVADLPTQDTDGKPITWINDFGVMDTSGSYVQSVNYTVYLPRRTKGTFVYRDQSGLKHDKTPAYRGSKPPKTNMVQVDFTTGDPGIGWR